MSQWERRTPKHGMGMHGSLALTAGPPSPVSTSFCGNVHFQDVLPQDILLLTSTSRRPLRLLLLVGCSASNRTNLTRSASVRYNQSSIRECHAEHGSSCRCASQKPHEMGSLKNRVLDESTHCRKKEEERKSLHQTELKCDRSFLSDSLHLLSVAHHPVSRLSMIKNVCFYPSLKHCNKNLNSVLVPGCSRCKQGFFSLSSNIAISLDTSVLLCTTSLAQFQECSENSSRI